LPVGFLGANDIIIIVLSLQVGTTKGCENEEDVFHQGIYVFKSKLIELFSNEKERILVFFVLIFKKILQCLTYHCELRRIA
jgi:hypothetical protein